jgi:hypothetical protein
MFWFSSTLPSTFFESLVLVTAVVVLVLSSNGIHIAPFCSSKTSSCPGGCFILQTVSEMNKMCFDLAQLPLNSLWKLHINTISLSILVLTAVVVLLLLVDCTKCIFISSTYRSGFFESFKPILLAVLDILLIWPFDSLQLQLNTVSHSWGSPFWQPVCT